MKIRSKLIWLVTEVLRRLDLAGKSEREARLEEQLARMAAERHQLAMYNRELGNVLAEATHLIDTSIRAKQLFPGPKLEERLSHLREVGERYKETADSMVGRGAR